MDAYTVEVVAISVVETPVAIREHAADMSEAGTPANSDGVATTRVRLTSSSVAVALEMSRNASRPDIWVLVAPVDVAVV